MVLDICDDIAITSVLLIKQVAFRHALLDESTVVDKIAISIAILQELVDL